MKRIAFIAFLLLLSASIYGASRLVVSPSTMKNGETKTLVDGDKTITIKKTGDDLDIKIDGGGKTHTIRITNTGDEVIIGRDALRGLEDMHIEMPKIEIPKILIDRSEIERHMPHAQSVFICPKDHTVLRVPEDKADQTYKCPVDGTTMEKRKTRGFGIFLDDFPKDDL